MVVVVFFIGFVVNHSFCKIVSVLSLILCSDANPNAIAVFHIVVVVVAVHIFHIQNFIFTSF